MASDKRMLDRRTLLAAAFGALIAAVVVLGAVLLLSPGDDDDTAAPPVASPTPTAEASGGVPTSTDEPSREPSAPVEQPTGDGTYELRADGSDLDGATVSAPLTVTVQDEAVESVTWTLDGEFLEKDSSPPYDLTVTPDPGEHELRARVESGGNRSRREVTFTVAADGATGAATPSAQSRPPAAAPGALTSVPPAPAARRVVQVSTADQLRAALAAARPGDRIDLADGTYVGDPQFEAPASGTKAAPIVLRGSRAAVLTTGSTDNGGYGLHVTGDHWRLDGFTVRTAKKGIVLDGSVGSVLVRLDVSRIGQEAVHFRSASSGGVIANSDIHDTGLKSPQFGEGVYVGSATSNWGEYGGGGPDRSDGVLIQGNRIWNTAAEGIDIKEGTRGGRIVGNSFKNAGTSNQNSADSWVDVKGSGWLIEGNTGSGTFLDAFQTHVIQGAPGSGEDNTFRANKVLGGVKGYAVSISPKPGTHGNVVSCDNDAGPAGQGLSNIDCTD